jgi:hypothetical protein
MSNDTTTCLCDERTKVALPRETPGRNIRAGKYHPDCASRFAPLERIPLERNAEMLRIARRKTPAVALPLVGALILSVGTQAAVAKGCIKGAAVGAVAGHVAGHHAVLGAVAGCAIGHHAAKKKMQQEQLQRQQQSQPNQPPPQQQPPTPVQGETQV